MANEKTVTTKTKAYVRIHSSMNIRVTPGLHYADHTNASAHIPDRLKIAPQWQKLVVFIKQGSDIYPAEVANWSTVKALVENKVITIGEYLDEPETEEQKQAKDSLLQNIKTVKANMKAQSLNDIAGE